MAPIGKHWMNFAYVNLAFVSIFSIMIYYASVGEINKNWGEYRCNPIFMPFSDNIAEDFAYCINNVQNKSIGPLLAPTTDAVTSLQTTSDKQQTQISNANSGLKELSDSITTNFADIDGKFANGSVEVQKITYGVKDLVSKLSAITVSLLYIMDGNTKAMTSIWTGPPGQVIKKLATLGHCFHPETNLKLKNGEIVLMKDVNLGAILENGSRVISVMKIDNSQNQEPLMKICGKGVNGKDIYVTGSHLIKEGSKFIKVENLGESKSQTNVKSEWYSCLITDNHLIKIGDHIFWDWEDYHCNFM